MSKAHVRIAPLDRAVFALVAIVLALRLIWVPLHLAHEAHVYGHGPSLAVVHEQSHDHDHDHDHDGDHPPHPAIEHGTEPIARKSSDALGFALLPIESALELAALPCDGSPPLQPADEVPRPPPPRTGRARAPPAA